MPRGAVSGYLDVQEEVLHRDAGSVAHIGVVELGLIVGSHSSGAVCGHSSLEVARLVVDGDLHIIVLIRHIDGHALAVDHVACGGLDLLHIVGTDAQSAGVSLAVAVAIEGGNHATRHIGDLVHGALQAGTLADAHQDIVGIRQSGDGHLTLLAANLPLYIGGLLEGDLDGLGHRILHITGRDLQHGGLIPARLQDLIQIDVSFVIGGVGANVVAVLVRDLDLDIVDALARCSIDDLDPNMGLLFDVQLDDRSPHWHSR